VDPTLLLPALGPPGVILILLLGAWTALDAAAVGQFMVARPLVAATLGGWVAGDLVAGMLAGILLEALNLAQVPAGGVRLPDPGPGSVVAGAVAALPGPVALGETGGALALALTLGVGLSLVGGGLVTRHRVRNAEQVTAAWSRGGGLGGALRGALARGAGRGMALVAAGIGVASLIPPAGVARWPLSLAGTVALVALPAFLGLGSVGRTPVPGRGRGLRLLVGGVVAGVVAGAAFVGMSGGGP